MELVKRLKRVVPRRLHRPLGMTRRWIRTIPLQTALQKKRLLSDPSLSQNERELLSKVSSQIYYNDGMYDGDGAHYYKVGLSALACINEVVMRAGLRSIRSILDFPCGSGRVLRFLAQKFPEAEITACELERGPVEFCVRTFGARPAFSSVNLDEVSLGKEFDLIWCGSLVTHLNDSDILALFRLFRRHLIGGGLLIFTIHGDFVQQRIPTLDFDYGLEAEQIDRIGVDYPNTGYGFENYPGERNYGVSLTSPHWIRSHISQLGRFREVFFQERGWDNHQDVFAFVLE